MTYAGRQGGESLGQVAVQAETGHGCQACSTEAEAKAEVGAEVEADAEADHECCILRGMQYYLGAEERSEFNLILAYNNS